MISISKPIIGDEEKQAVLEVLESGMLAQGKYTALLETKFAAASGTEHAIATSSGTTALQVALMAHGLGEGDTVITTPFTFIATVNSILSVGAKPVFVDIDAATFNIDPNLIEAAITPSTKAIVVVHLYGQICEMDSILAIAEKHNLAVIEDAAQAVGAEYKGKRAGSFGTGCFSLYATKNVMSGEGGMITTNDPDYDHLCRMIRNHGMQKRYHHEMIGYNFRISDLHSAIGSVQMDRLDDITKKRQANAEYLNEHIESVIKPTVSAGNKHVWHQYTIRVPDANLDGSTRDAAVKQLTDQGVGTGIFYPIPAHKHAYLRDYGIDEISLPVAEKAAAEVISLPIHPQLTRQDLEKIAYEVNRL
jgi:perosamine synthetase